MNLFLMLFNFIIIINTLTVILSLNIMSVLINLLSALLIISLAFLTLGSEFIAIIMVIIYGGAIVVLFLFVVMMLNLRIVEVYSVSINKLSLGLLFGVYYLIFYFLILKNNNVFFNVNFENNLLDIIHLNHNIIYALSNVYLFGDALYNIYSLLIFYVSVLLLFGMVGAMNISLDSLYHNVKYKISKSYKIAALQKTLGFFTLDNKKKNIQKEEGWQF